MSEWCCWEWASLCLGFWVTCMSDATLFLKDIFVSVFLMKPLIFITLDCILLVSSSDPSVSQLFFHSCGMNVECCCGSPHQLTPFLVINCRNGAIGHSGEWQRPLSLFCLFQPSITCPLCCLPLKLTWRKNRGGKPRTVREWWNKTMKWDHEECRRIAKNALLG